VVVPQKLQPPLVGGPTTEALTVEQFGFRSKPGDRRGSVFGNMRRTQLTRDPIRIQNQVERLLEETRIKLSSVVSDLFAASGLRILEALAGGETDEARLAALADRRLHCSAQQLTEALTGAVHRLLLRQHLDHLEPIGRQTEQLSQQTAILMQASSQAIPRHLSVAIWKILHRSVGYVQYGITLAPQLVQRRLQRINKQLRELGYSDELKTLQPQPQTA